jgi:hypothetical protein
MEYNENCALKIIEENSSEKENANYTIALDNPDGTKEVQYYLSCEENDALQVFNFVIEKQQIIFRKNGHKGWRVVRLFNKAGEQIRQES